MVDRRHGGGIEDAADEELELDGDEVHISIDARRDAAALLMRPW